MGQFGQREFDKFFLFFNNLLDDDLVHGNPSRRNSTFDRIGIQVPRISADMRGRCNVNSSCEKRQALYGVRGASACRKPHIAHMTQAATTSRARNASVDAAALLTQLLQLLAAPSPDAAPAFHNALETLADTPAEEASAQLVECLLTVAHYFYLSNQANTALLPTTQAERFARQLGERRLLRKALTFAGVMQMETGNLPGATETYSEALQVARELGEEEQEAPVWNNLGVALLSSAQYADAL